MEGVTITPMDPKRMPSSMTVNKLDRYVSNAISIVWAPLFDHLFLTRPPRLFIGQLIFLELGLFQSLHRLLHKRAIDQAQCDHNRAHVDHIQTFHTLLSLISNL